MASDLEDILTAHGLEQYLEVLESNHIEVELLRELNDADLKEIGITSLGHRRKLLAAVSEVSSPTGQMSEPLTQPRGDDLAQAASEDERIYIDRHVHLNGKETRIVVTSRRAIIGEKTYVLQNITSVEVGDDAEEVAEKNKEIEEKNKSEGWGGRFFFSLWLWFLAAMVVLPTETSPEVGIWHYLGAGVFFLLGLAGFSKAEKTPLFMPTYSIRVSAAGTVDNVLSSTDQDLVTEIVEALNTSIVNLNM